MKDCICRNEENLSILKGVIKMPVSYCPVCGRFLLDKEDYTRMGRGDDIWYVDFIEGLVEHGNVFAVAYKDGKVYSFSVDFDNQDFDEFDGCSLGKTFFLRKENAIETLRKGE